MKYFCPYCGTRIRPKSEYCARCNRQFDMTQMVDNSEEIKVIKKSSNTDKSSIITDILLFVAIFLCVLILIVGVLKAFMFI